jgi:hypothetical protein
MKADPLRIISLGWGVQSFALAAMSALGELPPVDAAIHADTTHERSETYAFAKRWTPWLEARGVQVVTVSDRKAASALFGKSGQTHLPAFTLKTGMVQEGDWIWAENGEEFWEPSGRIVQKMKQGQLRRSCTQRWKIAPQRRWISAELKRRELPKSPGSVDQWFGITKDEWSRMRDSDVRYVRNVYPFMDLDPPMTRHDVMRWLQDNGLEIPVKSACVFCPYHNLAAWREIKTGSNGDWSKAVEVDTLIRHKRPGYQCFVHPACIPLDQVDLRNEQDHGQLELWPEEECTGNCFL